MKLATAKHYANKIVTWLAPLCKRIEIAGSVRRERAVCNDVDIVCIPRMVEIKDLMGEIIERQNLAWGFLVRYVALSQGGAQFLSGGEREGKQAILELPKCQLDLWFASPETFVTRLLCRTGSKEHNIWFADRAKDRGGHWDPYEGLTINGGLVQPESEIDLYEAIGVRFIRPQDREIDWIRKNL
jgi:DNA polymerase/3'-5' exonuclease PolX